MSFYINNTNPNRPGPLSGNPINGICEKVLIETTKVFDACVSQTTETGIILPVTSFNPANPVQPQAFRGITDKTNICRNHTDCPFQGKSSEKMCHFPFFPIRDAAA